MTGVFLDNDILIKMSAYGLGVELLEATTFSGVAPSMLAIGRFVVKDRLARPGRFNDGARAGKHFEGILTALELIEPTKAEIEQAAVFEAAAARVGLEFDAGESQLLAMLLARGARLLVTGDKRAITAIAVVCGEAVESRIACLEQLLSTTVRSCGPAPIREAVCSEPAADKASTNCFTCSAATCPPMEDVLGGLVSYIRSIRESSGRVLFWEDDLLSLSSQEDGVGVDEASN